MTDQPANTGGQSSDRPLFENMDEMEREYAPEEVPGDERAAVETDTGGTAASSTAVTSTEGDQEGEPVSPVPPPASGFSFPASGVPPGPGPDDSDIHPLDEDDRTSTS